MATKKKASKKAPTAKVGNSVTISLPAPTPPVPKSVEQKVDKTGKAAFQTFVGQMRTKQHDGLIMLASEATSTYALRRPSGIMQLDIDTAGGLPAGGLSTLAGPDGAGKSELLYLYIAQHQRIYGVNARIALAHTEGQFDFWRAKRMGVQTPIPRALIEERRAILAQRGLPDMTSDQISYLQQSVGEFVLIQNRLGEETLEVVLDAIKSKAFGIVAIDSLQGLIPSANAAKDMDDENKRAAFATMITKFMSHYVPLCSGLSDPNYTTLIAISQVRANPDRGTNPYAPDFIVQLAKAMKHYHLMEIVLTTGQALRKEVRGATIVTGKELKWKLTKGKAGAHDNVTGSTSFIYPEFTKHGQSVDTVSTVITTGVRYGVIHETSSGVFIMRAGQRTGIDPAPDIPTLETMMRMDPEYEQAIRQEILIAARLDCRYT